MNQIARPQSWLDEIVESARRSSRLGAAVAAPAGPRRPITRPDEFPQVGKLVRRVQGARASASLSPSVSVGLALVKNPCYSMGTIYRILSSGIRMRPTQKFPPKSVHEPFVHCHSTMPPLLRLVKHVKPKYIPGALHDGPGYISCRVHIV